MPELPAFTDKDFDGEIADSELPVVVYVTARWCRPGRELAPIVEQIAEEVKGKVKVGALDADVERDFVREQGIRSLPTVLVFQAGKPGVRITGRFTKLQLMSQISSQIAGAESGFGTKKPQ